jgi:hypothetical protein
LVAFQGRGTIFLEASLPPVDARMIVAHEFGHFLADYQYPRRRAVRRVGPSLLAIFDADRPPTSEEKLAAALADVEIGAHVHYMERMPAGTYTEATNRVEQTANELALELIAPWQHVLAVMKAQRPFPIDRGLWVQFLEQRFGLPDSWARAYAGTLMDAATSQRSFSETLGL